MSDFDTLFLVRDELCNNGFNEFGIKVWPEMSEVDREIVKLEADNLIEQRLEPYRARFTNPDLFTTFVEYLQLKYRKKLAEWFEENPL